MTKYFRYTLATLCLAASVGCLLLWNSSRSAFHLVYGPSFPGSGGYQISWREGVMAFSLTSKRPHGIGHDTHRLNPDLPSISQSGEPSKRTRFGKTANGVYFPLWYPALMLALAGVGVIRFRRQFSIRSTLIAFAIVAALLAMQLTL
ncbi:hypothetical protein I41_08700 [Lacipirellula limnantheis]|uniref:Uncharacterized protein n=1 Tax=Lacipirellula limnantheis TaxID=2528024 RepID=A0A517TTK8_9BACT|nr:hypothetical protein I41_08700 [Lacipirellula limnantheis]